MIVGSKETDGTYDLAPKHMAMPLGWRRGYGFACTPRHRTYGNVERHGVFTVSFPHSFQIVQTALAASRREQDGTKPALAALPTFPARDVDGVLVHGCYAFLECELDRLVELDDAVARDRANRRGLGGRGGDRDPDRDDAELLRQVSPLAYLSPSRFASIEDSHSFPFPASFAR